MPEEISEPSFSWPDIEKYWTRGGGHMLRAFRWQFWNLRVKRLGSDLVLAIFDHFYEYQLPFPGATPMAGNDRRLAIFFAARRASARTSCPPNVRRAPRPMSG